MIQFAQSKKEDESYANVIPVVKEAFEKALAEAIAVNEDKLATQEEVDAAHKELSEKVDMLSFLKGDTTELQVLVDAVNGMNKDMYTAESWKAVAAALKEAEKTLADENATQKEVDAARDALKKAVDALEKNIDRTKLQQLVDDAKECEEAIAKYTPETAKIFTAALANARDILAKENAVQEETDLAYATLLSAKQGLKLIPEKGNLTDLIEKAEKVNTSKYTAETVKAFNEALANAKRVYADENATEDEVKTAEKELKEAQNNLVKKSEVEEENKDSNSNNNNNNNNNSNNNNSNSNSTGGALTGDTSKVFIVIMLMLAAGAVAVLSLKKKARK